MKKLVLALALGLGVGSLALGKDGPFPKLMGIWAAENSAGTLLSLQVSKSINGVSRVSIMITDVHGQPLAVGETTVLVNSTNFSVPLYFRDGNTGRLQATVFTRESKRANVPDVYLRVVVAENARNIEAQDLVFSRLP